jgi:hypothetical protein
VFFLLHRLASWDGVQLVLMPVSNLLAARLNKAEVLRGWDGRFQGLSKDSEVISFKATFDT